MSQTTAIDDMVSLDSGRSLASKLLDIVSCLDYGAVVGGTATANTTAINAAIVAASGGFVLIPPGVSYTEASIIFADDVVLLVFGATGTLTILTTDYGSSPLAQGGLRIKAVGNSGVVLRSVDFGVTAEPFLQVVDAVGGDTAAIHMKFVEMDEIAAPANPSANKSRLYTRDNGAGKTQLVVQFPTGVVQVLATEP